MWRLNNILAKNLCSFKELDYQLLQNHTTLVFGNNMDNDSQGSNGSGKSAMLEAIAIGLTGESLRKVKMDEIINDAEDNATICLTLINEVTDEAISITREFSRKGPQEIKLQKTHPDKTEEVVVQATIADYNKYILEQIGITKEDIFSNYVLSKHKYSSFLSSSDREKKEIINRFSNGNLVDKSIEAIQKDMVPVQESLLQAETEVAVVTGKIDTLTEQINTAINESSERALKKSERIESWKQAIAGKRELIRTLNADNNTLQSKLDSLSDLDDELCDVENKQNSISDNYTTILYLFEKYELPTISNYDQKVSSSLKELKALQTKHDDLQAQIDDCCQHVEKQKDTCNKLKAEFNEFNAQCTEDTQDIKASIQKTTQKIKEAEVKSKKLAEKSLSLDRQIKQYIYMLSGTITCPKCKHEWITLHEDVDVQELREKESVCKQQFKETESEIAKNNNNIDKLKQKSNDLRDQEDLIKNNLRSWESTLSQANNTLLDWSNKLVTLKSSVTSTTASISTLKEAMESYHKRMFDEAFEILDEAISNLQNKQKQNGTEIKNAEGAIQSYEESIQEIENSSETDIIDNLKQSKQKYEKELSIAITNKENIEQELNSYKIQESTFIEFKTYLANTKIDALSHITNEFLQTIGSDIRIVFSGFTVLKSGKIRDKISISLTRDGIDCGSFDKFSEGEKARVNLANILAMNKLTNLNCDDEKGLNLLVLDEILEATDEQGLANIFNALNKLEITVLIVSHGNIAEGYPYKTVVNKLNGVSYINE